MVALAIPVTLALTLATFYLLDFTLNRVTLFALIFSIGILVDDPIVDVENVVRHFRLPENRGRPLKEVTVEAVNEVRSPLILATLTVIAAVLPMAFVQGLMGPYMRPIPIGCDRGHAVLHDRGLRGHALGRLPHAALACPPGRTVARYGGLVYPCLPPGDGADDPSTAVGRGVPGRPSRCCSWVRLAMVDDGGGKGQDAALRQQERAAGHRRYGRGCHAGMHHQCGPSPGRQTARRAGGAELPDLCRHRGTLQLQRSGASLLPAPRPQCRRHPGQPGLQGGAGAAEPRHRQAHPRQDPGSGGRLRGPDQGGRGAAGTAGVADHRGRNLRPRLRRADRDRPAGARAVRGDARRGGCRLVRRG